MRAAMRRIAIPLAILFVILLAVGIGIWGAVRSPITTSYAIDDPAWPAGAPPLRIVQLSDIHANRPFMPADKVEALVTRVNALKPDIIVLTGDYMGDGITGASPLPPAQAVAPFAGFRARFGIYAVLGNHDYQPNARGVGTALRHAGVRLLSNAHVAAGPITIVGVDDELTGHADLARAMAGIAGGVPTILLSHSPDIFPSVGPNVALTLSGHTHGGQIVLPVIGALSTESRYGRRYAHGHIEENGHDLIVSAGLGTSILPLRIGMPPEIVVITVR
jgi:predicted MPP superfamily phosphohydrolase